jgi:NAD(P)-dependent dehydrogenase (short-subunit alcohol dehydrogenase family)
MIFSDNCLADRRVLVTGASSGLGRAAAIAMSNCGAKIILSGRDATRLEETRAQLSGSEHRAVSMDVRTADEMTDFVKSIVKEGGLLDGIFHAAGISMTLPVRLIKQQQLEEVFRSSVYAAFGIARAAAQKNVVRDGGSIVFMSSVSALRGHNGMTVYSSAKAAVDGLVRSAAIELAPRRIRVNSILCGAVYTEMYAREVDRMGPEWIASIGAKHPLGFGRTDDISSAVIYLVSNASRWVTGSAMPVDGGYMAQ